MKRMTLIGIVLSLFVLSGVSFAGVPPVAIDVAKTGDELSKVGDPVDYTITVENNNELTLYKQSIVDSLLGDLTSDNCGASLAPGDSCTINVTRTVQAGDPDPLDNTVTVVYNTSFDLLGNEVSGSDDHSVNLFQPAVEIIKTGPDTATGGETITYNFTINNLSSADSPNLILDSVSDTVIGDLTAAAVAVSCGTLGSGGSCNFSADYTIAFDDPNPLVNVVTVLYHPEGFPNDITDDDDHSIEVLEAPLINDECTDAIGPLEVDLVTPGTTIGATSDVPPAPNVCGTSITAPGVWYTVVGTGNTMTASTCNDENPDTGSADYDTKISIFCADCEDMPCVAGQDDNSAECPGPPLFSTKLSWSSQAGATYLILVHGFISATGDFDLAILDDGVPVEADVVCKVDIDIKPGSYPNSINTSKCRGKIPVAILGDEAFDVMTVDVTTLAFGPDGASTAHDLTNPDTHSGHLEDVNYDSYIDLVSHYQCQDTGIEAGDTEACLSFEAGTDPDSDCFDNATLYDRQGCDDSVCEDLICSLGSVCCDLGWLDICAVFAGILCTVDLDSNCLEPANFLGYDRQGCDDSACETAVCAEDPFCCNTGWDGSCVNEAVQYCPLLRSFESCDSVRTVPSQ